MLVLVASLAACGVQRDALSAGSGSPAPTPASSCSDPIKCSTPPPGYTPYLGPPCDAPLTTASEIRIAAAQMYTTPGQPQASVAAYGDPVLVHPMRVGDPDEWLVLMSDGAGGAAGVVAVTVRANGRGCAGMASGWSGPFPRIARDAARLRATGPNDPVTVIEAVYLPFNKSLPPASELNLVWRAVRESGYEVFLFDSGDLVEGGLVRALTGESTPLRGAPAGSTARPGPTFRPLYSVSTADQALAGARNDAFVIDYLRYLRGEPGQRGGLVSEPRLDTPVRVIGLHKPYTVDLWVVPVRDRGGAVVSLIAVGDRDGSGQAMEARAWSGSFPRVSEADAKRVASIASDPAVSAQLGWAEEYFVSPGGPTAVSWLVTRLSGTQVVVTEEGAAVPPPR